MGPSVQQLLIVLAIIILIFGAKKIPELAKGLGSGIKNFKKAVKEDENTEDTLTATAQTTKVEGNPQVSQNTTLTSNTQNLQNTNQMSHMNNVNNNGGVQQGISPQPNPNQTSTPSQPS